jgi:tetrahydromethanopterin S-methyltransferase subunit E
MGGGSPRGGAGRSQVGGNERAEPTFPSNAARHHSPVLPSAGIALTCGVRLQVLGLETAMDELQVALQRRAPLPLPLLHLLLLSAIIALGQSQGDLALKSRQVDKQVRLHTCSTM